jgi:hypothetical protein
VQGNDLVYKLSKYVEDGIKQAIATIDMWLLHIVMQLEGPSNQCTILHISNFDQFLWLGFMMWHLLLDSSSCLI